MGRARRAGSLDCRASRPEVRRHLGGRSRPHPRRGRSRRPHPARRRRRRRRRVGDGQDHRRPGAARPRRRRAARRPRDGHAADRGRAHLDGAAVDGGRGPRRAGDVVHRVAGRDRHRHRARPGQDHRGQGRPHPRGARRRARSRSSPASRACRPTARSPRWAAAAPTSPRSRSRPRSTPTCARSTPTSKACTPPTRASCPSARKLARVSFDEMLEMAATGGRVLALRSVEFARNHHVQMHVRSSFTWAPGTWVTEEDPSLTSMEQAIISGVTHDVVRGQGHDRAGPRPARRRGHVCSARSPTPASTST